MTLVTYLDRFQFCHFLWCSNKHSLWKSLSTFGVMRAPGNETEKKEHVNCLISKSINILPIYICSIIITSHSDNVTELYQGQFSLPNPRFGTSWAFSPPSLPMTSFPSLYSSLVFSPLSLHLCIFFFSVFFIRF